jgi:hypothetical protein
VPHDHVVDVIGRDPRALERGADGDGAEVDRRTLGERAAEPPDRGPGAGDDDGGDGQVLPVKRDISV